MTQPVWDVLDAQSHGGGLCPNCGLWGRQHHAPRCYLEPPFLVRAHSAVASWLRRRCGVTYQFGNMYIKGVAMPDGSVQPLGSDKEQS